MFNPHVIWAQLEGAASVLQSAAKKGIQGLLFVHDAEFDPRELRRIGDLGCHVVCSSDFLAGQTCKVIGRTAHVVYPCPETEFGVAGDPQGYVTMINPHRVKGIETFIEIATRMPVEKFLLVESWKLMDRDLAALEERLAGVPNVRFVRRVSDMRQVYGQTKLLLVPSVWEEGFGMVAVEAQSCGIPVIASARGGLPESVGDGGLLIDDYLNAHAWVSAIGHLSNDDAHYAAFAARAAHHAASESFTASFSARRFYDICSSKVRPRKGMGYIPGLRSLIRWASR
jgi:glycosyltransferase involved in cell wall biosynthesis